MIFRFLAWIEYLAGRFFGKVDEATYELECRRLERHKTRRNEWAAVRRGFGSIELSELAEDECVTASGLRDGGYIVWKKKRS